MLGSLSLSVCLWLYLTGRAKNAIRTPLQTKQILWYSVYVMNVGQTLTKGLLLTGGEGKGQGNDCGGVREHPHRLQRPLHRGQHRQDGRQAIN